MSIRQLFPMAALALSAAVPLAVQGQPAPAQNGAISLAQVLQAARGNLDVQLSRQALAGAQGDVLAADHAPLPTLSVKAGSMDLQNGIGPGNLMTEKRIDKSIGIDWTWERGNKRALRTEVAQRSAAAAQADLEEVQMQQLLAASAAYYDLAAAQERVLQVTVIERSAAQLANSAQRRVQAGDLAAQDAARTEIEARRAQGDTLGAQLDLQRAAISLAQLAGFGMGQVSAPGLRVMPEWPRLDSSAVQADSEAADKWLGSRADVRAAGERVQAAQAALDGASAQKKADITWGTSIDHFPGTSTRQLELRMQMPLQLGAFGGYSYQGEVARAQANLTQAQAALEKTRLTALAEMQRLAQERATASARALSYEQDILPRARKVVDNAELAYTRGAMSLTDLLDARRTLRTILLEAVAARAEHAKVLTAWQLRTQRELLGAR
jgi:cobalt-zinc-cadmium efflux system outer membrane protein